MEYRRMKEAETKEVVLLWQEVFGDSKEEAEKYLTQFVGVEHEYVAVENGAVCAILSAVPCEVYHKRGAYFFALATKESHRGKGVMQSLMQHAENCHIKKGYSFSCLVPASRSLFAYYQKQGYSTLYQRKVVLELQEKCENITVFQLEISRLLALRRRYQVLQCILLTENALKLALSEADEAGYKIAESQDGYAVFMVHDELLLVAELCAKDEKTAMMLLSSLGLRWGCQKAVVLFSQVDTLFLKQSTAHKAAQIKILSGQWNAHLMPRLYFALDALFEKDYDQP